MAVRPLKPRSITNNTPEIEKTDYLAPKKTANRRLESTPEVRGYYPTDEPATRN
jgi:hypothetical protein